MRFRFVIPMFLLASLLAGCSIGTAVRLIEAVRPRPFVSATPVPIPMVSLEEAQAKVDFPIPQPGWLPEGFTVQGARAMPPDWAMVLYRPSPESDQVISLEVTLGEPEGDYTYPGTAAQAVTVSGQEAVCIQGAWDRQGQWQAATDVGALSWHGETFHYRIGYAGFDFTCEGLLRVAESLPAVTTAVARSGESDAAGFAAAPQPLEQALKEVDFPVRQPEWLPFEPTHTFATLLPINYWPGRPEEDLLYMLEITYVSLEGEIIVFFQTPDQVENFSTGRWEPIQLVGGVEAWYLFNGGAYRLQWQDEDFHYRIAATGESTGSAEVLIRIAESLQIEDHDATPTPQS